MTWERCNIAIIAWLLTRVTQTCWEWDCHPALVQVTSWSYSQGYIVVIGLTNSAFKAVLPSLQPILHPTQSTCVKWMHDSKIIQKYGRSVGLSFHSLCHFRRCVTASLYHNYILSQHDTHVNLCFDTRFSLPKSCFSKSLYCETINMSYITQSVKITHQFMIKHKGIYIIVLKARRGNWEFSHFFECFYKTFYLA